jgi:hypothetical protein
MITSDLRRSFFDSELVMKKVDAAKRKALSKQGAFIRRRAKSSIKYSSGPNGGKRSAPGSPPAAHRVSSFTRHKKSRKSGKVTSRPASPLRELIYFAYDGSTDSVVIGPEVFRNAVAPGVAPRALEKGGTTTIKSPKGPKSVYVQPRPFMAPAELAERPKFAQQFQDSL